MTAILLNYQRPDSMAALIEALGEQTLRPRTILVDNAASPHPLRTCVDRYVHVPWNGGCFMRLYMAHYVETEYVVFIDDDRVPADRKFIEDAVRIAKEHPLSITGAHGRILSRTAPHYQKDAWGEVEIMKGFFMAFAAPLISGIPISPPFQDRKEVIERCDDIHLSLMSGRGKAVHWADARLHQRLSDKTLPGVGYSFHPEHNEIREHIAKRYLDAMGAMTW